MAPHSSTLAWRIPGTGEPGGLPSLGSHRVRHDWSDLAAAYVTLGFPSGSAVKNPPAIQEMWLRSLVQEDPLEEGMRTDSYILAWRIPETEGPGGLQSIASQRVRNDWSDLAHIRNINFYHLNHLKGYIQFRSIKYIYIAVQLSPPSIFKTSSTSQLKLCPLNDIRGYFY